MAHQHARAAGQYSADNTKETQSNVPCVFDFKATNIKLSTRPHSSLAHKTLRQGFYWPTLFADSKRVAARCEACQKIANNIRQPPELLQSITSPWPFAMWGIDLIGPMPTATGGAKHAKVAVDYFTKWVEAEPLVHITKANTISFVKKNILYRFGTPNTIITDNGTQFDGRKFKELCDKYGINNYYASPAHPQTNGQTEAVNKIIKHNLKAKLATKKGSWADKLPQVLWAYRTTERGSTGETPYSMAYGSRSCYSRGNIILFTKGTTLSSQKSTLIC
ncbi:hypothetical protein LWI29_033886 [Acer saccharum]|uniref:Integrase catalytic domain-containing protein n=1 Tax=Acer saccharum TaxID=4024 RepID=A0AA39RP01_ACESA|nr:hypothetical protein LWI29_033886 [Acer saccharum]